MGSRSKQKGSAFERQTCKQLSLWMTNGKRDDLFWRSAMSGGRASVQFKKKKKNSTQEGDISAIDPIGHRLTDKFVLECKHYKDLKLNGLITGSAGGIAGFWTTLYMIADRQKKWPMLIAKQNQFPTLVGLSGNGVYILFDTKLPPYVAHYPDRDLYLVPLETLLNCGIPPK